MRPRAQARSWLSTRHTNQTAEAATIYGCSITILNASKIYMLRKSSLLTSRGKIHVMKIYTADLLSCAGTKLEPAQHGEPTGIFVEIISTNKSKRPSKIYSLKKCMSKIVCNIHKKAMQNNNIPLGSSITLSHNKAAYQIRTMSDKTWTQLVTDIIISQISH